MSFDGTYKFSAKSIAGTQEGTMIIKVVGDVLTGKFTAMGTDADILDGKLNGNDFSGRTEANSPMGKMKLTINGTFEGARVSGKMKAPFGSISFSGEKV